MSEMTPHQVVEHLDKHIIGQTAAKRAVAIALRNRWRWLQLSDEMRKEVTPRNILMIGPTGVGKTEITRRLAGLTGSPFIKIEATKYTEVGYYGRDVESMIRDLVEMAIGMVRTSRRKEVEAEAEKRVEDRLLKLLVPMDDIHTVNDSTASEISHAPHPVAAPNDGSELNEEPVVVEPVSSRRERTMEKFRQMLRNRRLRLPRHFRQLIDRLFALAERAHDLQPGLTGHRLKDTRGFMHALGHHSDACRLFAFGDRHEINLLDRSGR